MKIRRVRTFLIAGPAFIRCVVAIVSMLAWIAGASAQDSMSIADVNRLMTTPPGTPDRLVTIRGLVNHSVPHREIFGIQEGESGVMVRASAGMQVPPVGTEVEVKVKARYLGETIDTVVIAESIQVIENSKPLPFAKAALADVFVGKYNRTAVEIEAVVVSASSRDGIWFLFLADGISAANGLLYSAPQGWSPDTLVGSRVRFRGIVGGAGFNALRCSSPEEITVIGPATLAEAGVTTEARELVSAGLATAKRALPVKLRGVCTYPNTRRVHFYLHDGTAGVVVNLSEPDLCPAYGEEVEVWGVSSGYQEVIGVNAVGVKKIGAGTLPSPAKTSVSEFGSSVYSQWLEIEGVVIQARANAAGGVQLHLAGDNGWCSVNITKSGNLPLDSLYGARLRCRGVNAGFPRIALFCADAPLVTVVQAGRKDPFESPRTSAEALLSSRQATADRVRVEGTVLDVKDGWIYLRNQKAALRADLIGGFQPDAIWNVPLTPVAFNNLPQVGEYVEIVGSPMVVGTHVDLRFSQVKALRKGESVEPLWVPVPDAAKGVVASNLVTVRGRLRDYFSGDYASSISASRWREVLRVEQDGSELEIVYENAGNRGALANFKIDDQIEATGIVRPEDGKPPYRLRLRTLADLRSLGVAPEVLRARQWRIFGSIAAVILAAATWIILLRGKLKRERLLAAERMRADAAVRELNSSLESRVGQRTAELQKAHEDLERALAAEREVGELKSRFVSLVSHEFRTPLGITMSAVELMRGYFDRLSKEKRDELLDDIHEATLRMSGMMEQVLLLGRVEAGKLSFNALPIDLEEFGAKFVDEMHSATNRKCEVQLTTERDLSGSRGDESLMRHALANLISNAVKYSPPGAVVHFHIKRDGDDAVFTIRDHGIGIPVADQIRLFEAFHRAKNVGETPGTGLGLLIVKRCVELHRGTIAFESRENEGTTFTVRFPLFADASGG